MSAQMTVLLSLVAAMDIALAAWILLRGGGPIDAARIALVALVSALFLVLQCAGFGLLGRGFFLWVHLAYLMSFYAVPASALLVLAVQRRRTVSTPARALAAASLLVVPLGVHATWVEPFKLVLERADVPIAASRLPGAPLKIGVLADVQCTRVTAREREAVARVMAEAPDLILLPGDLMQLGPRSLDEALPEFRELLAPLEAPLGVFFALGNTDTSFGIRRVTEGTRVRLLENEVVTLMHAGREVLLCGVDLSFASPGARRALAEIEHGAEDSLRLVLAHRPDVVYALPASSRVDLVVAGHTHGGQVVVPGFGPPVTLTSIPRAAAAGGLHTVASRLLYVSRGIGCERGHAPRVRLFCPPEITLLTLLAAPAP